MDKRRDIEKLWYFDTEEDFSGRSLSLSRKVDLKSYNDYETIGKSPDWIDWTDSESLEFDFVAKRILKIYADKFILQASEYGISRYERILGIEPGKNESLEDRRKRVYLLWNKKIRWTHRTFLKWLDVYLGKDNYKLSLDYDKYGIEIEVTIKESLYFDLDDLGRQVRDIIPANLTQFIRIKFIREQTIYYGMYAQKAKHYKVLPNKVEDKEFKHQLFMGMATYHKKIKRVAIMPEVWTLNKNDMFLEVEDGSGVRMKYD